MAKSIGVLWRGGNQILSVALSHYTCIMVAAEGDHIRRFNYNYNGADDELPDDATHVTIAASVTVIRRDTFHGNQTSLKSSAMKMLKRLKKGHSIASLA